MKPIYARVTLTVILLFAVLGSVHAKSTLEPNGNQSFPSEVHPGEALSFSLKYTGDPPKTLTMIVETPEGATVRVPTKASVGDPSEGVTATWPYTPQGSGTYRYHFEASAGDLGGVRYPENASDDLQFSSTSFVAKYVIFVVGVFIALAFLPFVVYVASRAANKRGDPAAAARIAILIGVLASYGLFIYLFYSSYGPLQWTIGAVVAVGLVIILFTRRTPAR